MSRVCLALPPLQQHLLIRLKLLTSTPWKMTTIYSVSDLRICFLWTMDDDSNVPSTSFRTSKPVNTVLDALPVRLNNMRALFSIYEVYHQGLAFYFCPCFPISVYSNCTVISRDILQYFRFNDNGKCNNNSKQHF